MARKRSKNKNKTIKVSSKRLLDNSEEEETDLSKRTKKKLEHNLISVTISNKHPEIDINDYEIQRFFISIQLINRSRIR